MSERGGEWTHVALALPGDGMIVDTKIHDGRGVRNETKLKLVGNLWYFPDGSMYVYYNPTHWRETQ